MTKEDHETPSNAELIADDPNDPYEEQGQSLQYFREAEPDLHGFFKEYVWRYSVYLSTNAKMLNQQWIHPTYRYHLCSQSHVAMLLKTRELHCCTGYRLLHYNENTHCGLF